jgi:CO/xanthine dehydrogenase Mo-binding subunit
VSKRREKEGGFSSVGKPVPRIEGVQKVSGQAVYTADQLIPGMIWGKVLRSPHPHARIIRIDTTRAKSFPGVLAVLTSKDVPESLTGRRLRDMPILARDRVRFVGEKAAVVAAEDVNVAEEAANLIEVEYEELPAVFDPSMAIAEGAPTLHEQMNTYKGLPQLLPKLKNVYSHDEWSIGNAEDGFREADRIFEDTFITKHVHQGYLEPHSSVMAVNEKNGTVRVWVSNKVPYDVKRQLSEATGVPPEKIVVHLSSIGGDFGGKGSLMDLPLCYFLAKLTGRPVKMVMTYAEELMASNPRHPAVVTMKTGVKNDGRLVARQVKVFWNGGAYGAMKPIPTVNLPGAVRAAGCYNIPNVRIDSYAVYTNCVPCGHFRAPGQVQLAFAGESQMDMIAEALGINPLELRLRNALRDGDITPEGKSMKDVKCREVLDAVAQACNWSGFKKQKNVGRGLAVAHRNVGTGDANARVTIQHDGTVSLLTTYTDTGTGSYTVLCQIVAEVLEIPVQQIKLEVGTTDTFRSESGTGASRVTHVLGHAALQAAQKVKMVLKERAAQMFHCSPGEVVFEKGRLFVNDERSKSLSIAQVVEASAAKGDPIEVQSYFKSEEVPAEGVFSACVAEVYVDEDTGKVHVRRLTTAHDIGTILNPVGHQGQIDGGIVQGFGFALMEEILMEEGRVTTLNLGDYKIPNLKDIAPLKTVLVQATLGPAPFQSKEIGESAISQVAPAIANAVYDAVGVRIKELPITAEKVYFALQAHVGRLEELMRN